MLKVTLIGKGNVSQHLQRAFSATKEVLLLQVLGSRKNDLTTSLKSKEIQDKIYDSDVCIVAVSDNAIASVSQSFIKFNILLTHTSGSVSINDLPEGMNTGVFYPLQTFSKDRKVDFKNIPICVEAKTVKNVALLQKLAGTISDTVHEISSKKRKALHLAAVLVNNFSNHLYQLGHDLCEDNQVPFELLKPLIKETALKMESLSPEEAQTGPAIRNDQNTIDAHLEQLKDTNHKEIYRLLTLSIQNTYEKKL